MSDIEKAAAEALAIAKGEIPAARIYHNGHFYVPHAEFEQARARIEQLEAALRDALSYSTIGDMPVTIYENARAALEGK